MSGVYCELRICVSGLHGNFTATFKMIASRKRAHSFPMRDHYNNNNNKNYIQNLAIGGQRIEKFMQTGQQVYR